VADDPAAARKTRGENSVNKFFTSGSGKNLLTQDSICDFVGGMKFKTWMQLKGLTQQKAAPMIGCSQQLLSELLLEKRKPSPEQVQLAHEVTGGLVTANDWFDHQPTPKLPKWAKGAARD
jgi:hypothetical protein